MGVTGLTTFMYDNSELFFEPFKLKNTRLIIDGHSLASNLYIPQQSHCCYGGDYDIYYEYVKEFFLKLMKCNVQPFVIMDGGMDAKKMKTHIKRGKDRLHRLRNFQLKQWKNMFFPIFLYEVFKDVLMDLNIKFATCWFEADQEIASLACFLDCPVMSCDSDFFIYGCMYIPINKTCYDFVALDKETDSHYISCEIYHSMKLAQLFGGDTRLLPYIAVLKGNDYGDAAIFESFFKHISIHVSSGTSYGQAKMRSLIRWLKNETVETIRASILRHVRKVDSEKALRLINAVVESYELKIPASLEQLELIARGEEDGEITFPCGSSLTRVPYKFLERYRRSEIPPFVIDMIHLNKYYPFIQVEDVTKESSHVISFPILAGIYYVVRHLVGTRIRLRVMCSLRGELVTIPLQYAENCFSRYNEFTLMFAPQEVKINFIYDVLNFDESDIYVVEHFGREWRIFAMSIVFWMKNAGDDLCKNHFHALVLMALVNIAQSTVGFFRNYRSFMQSKAGRLFRLAKTPPVLQEEIFIFPDMLENVSELEHLKIMEKFMKLRGIVKEVAEKGYYMRTIHVFAMFQSVLYHVVKLNELMGYPYPRTYVNKIYSGTLAYNFCYFLEKKERSAVNIRSSLETEPNILYIYDYFAETFAEYYGGDAKLQCQGPMPSKKGTFRRRRRC